MKLSSQEVPFAKTADHGKHNTVYDDDDDDDDDNDDDDDEWWRPRRCRY